MSNGLILTNQGKGIVFHRFWTPSPIQSSPTIFKVGTGTSTPAITDTNLQTPIDITTGVQTKIFDAGYPTLDTTNLISNVRTLLLTTEANGNSITEFGIFNTDSPNKCFSRAVFTPITKTNTVQIIVTERDKIS